MSWVTPIVIVTVSSSWAPTAVGITAVSPSTTATPATPAATRPILTILPDPSVSRRLPAGTILPARPEVGKRSPTVRASRPLTASPERVVR